jgi:hypothetical protein
MGTANGLTRFTPPRNCGTKLKPAAEPDGYYPLVKSPYHHYLYDIAKATPRRIPTVR